MSGWNTDISQAPRGRMVEITVQTAKGPRTSSRLVPDRVIMATKCGKVTLSHFIPDEDDGRWQMLGKGEEPVAWFAWPEYPHSVTPSPPGETDKAGEVVSPPLASPADPITGGAA